MGFRLVSALGDLSDMAGPERPLLLILAVPLYAGAVLAFALLWREVLSRLDGFRVPTVDSVAVFCASWLGRYVPSSLPYLAGKIAMGLRLGHSKPALAASVLYEYALVLSIGAVTSSILIPIALAGNAGGPLVFVGAGLGGLAGLVVLSPPVFHRLIAIGTRAVRRDPVARADLLSYRGILAGGLFATLALALNGASFAVVLSAFVDLSAAELVASAAIFNLAGVAGVAALPVPSGLGVREAVLIGMLQMFVPLEVAIAAAVVARLGNIVVDVAFGLAGAGTFAVRQRSAAASVDPVRQRQLDAA